MVLRSSEKCDSLNRSVVLSLLADYTPRSTEEMLALLDTLESQLIIASPLIILVRDLIIINFSCTVFALLGYGQSDALPITVAHKSRI